VSASVIAVYEENKAANEIGVYGIYFTDQKSADDRFKKLLVASKEHSKNKKAFPYIQKGRLLLYAWMDDDVSDQAFEKVVEYFGTTRLK
jgi:hypothetical protein